MNEKTITYITDPAVCSSAIEIVLKNGVIHKVAFSGGCPGNTEGLSRLIVGMAPEQVIPILRGIRCGEKNTSCPDQLAIALQKFLSKNNG